MVTRRRKTVLNTVLTFEPQLTSLLPETQAILESANLKIHPWVSHITLHGSRGPGGGYRHDSDIDLCLIIDTQPENRSDFQEVLHEILETVLNNWHSTVEPDLAAVFDIRKCGLKCFDRTQWDEQLCSSGGIDCLGLYKIQKGFSGFVINAGVQVKRMYPCLRIWHRM